MKSGIVRRLDELGRITLPKELRDTFGIKERDPIEIYVEEGVICLEPVKERCILCKSKESLSKFRGKLICKQCRQAINER